MLVSVRMPRVFNLHRNDLNIIKGKTKSNVLGAYIIIYSALFLIISYRDTSLVINGPVISFTVSTGQINADNPVTITFQHFQVHVHYSTIYEKFLFYKIS